MATNQNGDTPKLRHQNSDRLPWPKHRQVKTVTGTAWHGSYTRWTCVLGRRPQYTTRSRRCYECCQPYGFNNRLTSGCLMFCYKTRPECPGCWGCWCWDVRPHFIAVVCLFCSPHAGCRRDIHWTSTDSSQHCCLLSVYRMVGTASTWWRHMTPRCTLSSTGSTAPSQRIQSHAAHSRGFLHSKIVDFSQFWMLQPRPSWCTGHLVMSTLHIFHSETAVGCGLGSTSISSWPCLFIDDCTLSLLPISLWSLPVCCQLQLPMTSFIVINIVTDSYVTCVTWNVQLWCSMLGETDLTGRIVIKDVSRLPIIR